MDDVDTSTSARYLRYRAWTRRKCRARVQFASLPHVSVCVIAPTMFPYNRVLQLCTASTNVCLRTIKRDYSESDGVYFCIRMTMFVRVALPFHFSFVAWLLAVVAQLPYSYSRSF